MPLVLRVRLEVPNRNQHSFLDETHDVFVVFDFDPAFVPGGYSGKLMSSRGHERGCYGGETCFESSVEVGEVSRSFLFEHSRSRSFAPGMCSCRIRSVVVWDCS